MSETYRRLTDDEIRELRARGRALLSRLAYGWRAVVGRVRIVSFISEDINYEDDNPCMAIYWDDVDGRTTDCYVENNHGALLEDGEEFAARRALRVLREHMVLDDLARA